VEAAAGAQAAAAGAQAAAADAQAAAVAGAPAAAAVAVAVGVQSKAAGAQAAIGWCCSWWSRGRHRLEIFLLLQVLWLQVRSCCCYELRQETMVTYACSELVLVLAGGIYKFFHRAILMITNASKAAYMD
jgi:hypothetical protein